MDKPIGQYEEVGQAIGRLVDAKNRVYGDSFRKAGQILRIIRPQGCWGVDLDDLLAVVRIIDKIFRILTDRDALGEDPWRDIAGYAILRCRQIEEQREAEAGGQRG
jgi:hypothetical protein